MPESYPSEADYRSEAVEPALDALGFRWDTEIYQADSQMFADYLVWTPMFRIGLEVGNDPRDVAVEVGQSIIYAGPLPNSIPLVVVPPPLPGDETALSRIRHVRERVPVWLIHPEFARARGRGQPRP